MADPCLPLCFNGAEGRRALTEPLVAAIRNLADDIEFSGAVRIEDGGRIIDEFARGFAHRALAIPNQVDTRFAVASAMKGFTALAVMSLVQSRILARDAPGRGRSASTRR